MPTNFKDNERELIRLVGSFRRRADNLITEGRLSEEHAQVITACDKLTDTLDIHAANRAEILQQRDFLKEMIKDNALCPRCGKNTHLKHISIEKNEKGWKCNKYRCRRCNI